MVNWDRGLVGKIYSRTEQHVTRQKLLDYAGNLGMYAAGARGCGGSACSRIPRHHRVAHLRHLARRGPIARPKWRFRASASMPGYAAPFAVPSIPCDTLTYTNPLADLYEKTGRSGTMRLRGARNHGDHSGCQTVAVLRN